ncbi:hypothetical protein [Streptomyces sp. NPDC048350]|uniref:hypothetical protein n=1 Tax=Streptomyces sp. NPDC048350 TaxID=3365538 RepID=UPI003720B1CA
MTNNSEPTSGVQALYAERFAADLAANRAAQEDVGAQIAELQGRLEQLREDEKWLIGMQGSLPLSGHTESDGTSVVAEARAVEAQVVPQQRPAAEKSAKPGRGKTTTKTATMETPQGKRAVKRAGRKQGGKTSGGKTAKPASTTAGRSAAQPPLHELIHALLAPGEPRVVREIHEDLELAHPHRKTSAQVVRNSLESLVKKGLMEKRIQQGSAMYTACGSSSESGAGDASSERVNGEVPVGA